MTNKILCAFLALTATVASAQETYQSAELTTEDLNGTSRYVSMGGAMEALGADISTINTNPAGVAMFRRPWAGVSAGLTVQRGDERGGDYGRGVTNVDLNQLGFVYAFKHGDNSWFNLAINYSKSRNFNQIFTAENALDGLSSSNLTSYLSLMNFGVDNGSMLDQLNYNSVFNPLGVGDTISYAGANGYGASTKTSGYISNFDFNFAANINERVYLGITFGVKDVRYDSWSTYYESLNCGAADGVYQLTDRRDIRGAGFNLKLGAIIRPVADSPFRFGVYLNTPTWYELNSRYTTTVSALLPNAATEPTVEKSYTGDNYYKFKVNTPWKFGVSLGSTFGNNVAMGFTYQYSDYSAINNRVKTGEYYDYDPYTGRSYGTVHSTYDNDRAMNRNSDYSLRGVHLLKFGLEVKPAKCVSLRAGYNYETAAYNTYGSKDFMVNPYPYRGSAGGNYHTLHSFVNWRATHRATFGLGFMVGETVNIDLAYQYITQSGEYHPFESSNVTYTETSGGTTTSATYVNTATACEVSNTRHQVNATVGVRF